jgi:hypothetical protein
MSTFPPRAPFPLHTETQDLIHELKHKKPVNGIVHRLTDKEKYARRVTLPCIFLKFNGKQLTENKAQDLPQIGQLDLGITSRPPQSISPSNEKCWGAGTPQLSGPSTSTYHSGETSLINETPNFRNYPTPLPELPPLPQSINLLRSNLPFLPTPRPRSGRTGEEKEILCTLYIYKSNSIK